MADIENGRCHPERAPLESPPLVQNGKIILQGAPPVLYFPSYL